MGWVLWDMRCVHDSFFWMHETRKGGASWLCLFGISLLIPTEVTSANIADTTFKIILSLRICSQYLVKKKGLERYIILIQLFYEGVGENNFTSVEHGF